MKAKGFLLLICASLLAWVSCSKSGEDDTLDYFGFYTEKVYTTVWVRQEDGTPLRGEIAVDGVFIRADESSSR